MSSTIRLQLAEGILSALRNATIAGTQVYWARDWPTDATSLASGILLLYAFKERKERIRSGLLQYNTTATVDVLARVARGGPETSLKMCNVLAEQVSYAVITNLALHKMTNYAPGCTVDIGLTADGEMQIAQALISFEFVYPEKYQLGGVPLTEITNGISGSYGSFSVLLAQS
jgi:hypothetical protein